MVTRSMHSTHTISGHMVNQQASKPAVVNIEDDIPSSIPDTINVNNPTFVQGNAYQDKIMEFKGKLKHCLSSTTLLEEENRTFRGELLEWIDRWKKMSTKKNQYKKSKKSILGTNQLLLE